METPIHIADCQEPWIYWWGILTFDERMAVKERYFPDSWPMWSTSVPDHELKRAWERERPHPLQDYDWIDLADRIFRDQNAFNPGQQKEIWRQVYRIASGKI